MNSALGRKVVKGLGWTFAISVCVRLLQFLTMILLARLLVPSQFGLFALGSMIVTAIVLFRDLGLGEALLYFKNDLKKNADTTFAMSLVFGLLTLVGIYLAAPLVVTAFGTRELVWPLRVMGISVLLSSASLVPAALLERQLEFRKRAVPEIATALTYSLVSVALAFLGYGVWSLVAGYVVSTAAGSALTLYVAGWRPSIAFDKESARRVLAFGKPLMASSLLLLAFFYVDQAAIGRWLDTSTLGCYSMAFTICHLPATNITFVVNRVMYPVYSRLNEDISAVRKAYAQTVRSLAMISFPAGLWICMMAQDFTGGFFGEKWIPAVPMIHVLAFYGMVRSVGATADSVFMATGRTKWVFRINLLQIAIVLPLLYPVTMRYGAVGVAGLFTAAYTIGAVVALWQVVRIIEMPGWNLVGLFRFPLITSLTAVSVAYAASWLVPHGVIATIVAFVLTVLLYTIITLTFDRESVGSVRWMISHARGRGETQPETLPEAPIQAQENALRL